jgi:hypothetical protein
MLIPYKEIYIRALLTIGCFTLLAIIFSPSFGAYLIWAQNSELTNFIEVRRGVSVLMQVENPGAEILDTMHGVIQWRLLFPLIGHLLHLSPPVFFSLAHLGCLILLGVIVTLLRRNEFSIMMTAMASLVLGATSWFFTSISWLGYFDSWLALGLLATVVSKSPWTLWTACLLTPWVDERFVIAAPLVLICRYLYKSVHTVPGTFTIDMKREICVPICIMAFFVLIRLWVCADFSSSVATFSGYLASQNNLSAPAYNIILGIWDGLRVSWIFVALALYVNLYRRWIAVALACCTLLVIFAGIYSAKDFSRSMTMVFPVAFVGVVYLKTLSAQRQVRGMVVLTLLALVIPAHHVMDDRIIPVLTVFKEIYYIKTVAPTYIRK